VSTHRTAWHFFFAILLRKRGPRWIEVRDEVPLSDEPIRLDFLLLSRVPEVPADDPGQTLRGLWPLLPPTTIAELKTIGRPYRARNLDRLLGYLHLYFAAEEGGAASAEEASLAPSGTAPPGRRPRAIERLADLAGLLIVPARTPTLEREIAERGLTWTDLGGGYAELRGGIFHLLVAELEAVAREENDDMLRLFTKERSKTEEARQFWAEQVGTKEAMMAVHELEDYDEVTQRLLSLTPPEKWLNGLAPDEVARALSGVAPEQRLAGLGTDQLLPVMPDEVLRALNADFIDGLPEPTRSAVRKRLGR
jgi:hypothetical protein